MGAMISASVNDDLEIAKNLSLQVLYPHGGRHRSICSKDDGNALTGERFPGVVGVSPTHHRDRTIRRSPRGMRSHASKHAYWVRASTIPRGSTSTFDDSCSGYSLNLRERECNITMIPNILVLFCFTTARIAEHGAALARPCNRWPKSNERISSAVSLLPLNSSLSSDSGTPAKRSPWKSLVLSWCLDKSNGGLVEIVTATSARPTRRLLKRAIEASASCRRPRCP